MRWIAAIGAALICLPVAAAPPGQQKAGNPNAVKPPAAQKKPAAALNDPLINEAVAAVDDDDYHPLQVDCENQLRPLLDDLKHLDAPLLIRLSAFRTFSRYFSRLHHPDAATRTTLKWLVHQPHLMPTLMLAISDSDPPDGLARLLTALRIEDAAQLDDYSELTAAICVVHDKAGLDEPDDAPLDLPRAILLLHYYINYSGSLQLNPRTMPWQLLVYVVDLKAGPADILWALRRYEYAGNLAAAYFDVPYNEGASYNRESRQSDEHSYTLENLNKHGGVCTDQAYYAAQVCKTLGVPACEGATERGAGEPAHAWIGALNFAGVPYWDFQTARYADFRYWSGAVTDPQTLEDISEGDVSVLAELRRSTPIQRQESIALLKASDLADDAARFDLLAKAVDLSPANRAAWTALVDWCGGRGAVDTAKWKKAADVIEKFAMRAYPEFAFGLAMRMARNQPYDDQVKSLDYFASVFGSYPVLTSRARIKEGDLLKQNAEDLKALQAYGQVLLYHESDAAAEVTIAMARVDQMLRNDNDTLRLAAIYDYVWRRLPRPNPSAYARSTAYCIIGAHYAELLDDLYATSMANEVRAMLDGLQSDVR